MLKRFTNIKVKEVCKCISLQYNKQTNKQTKAILKYLFQYHRVLLHVRKPSSSSFFFFDIVMVQARI